MVDDKPTDSMECVRQLIQKASTVHDAGDAMKFAQAALNAANAMCSLITVAHCREASDSMKPVSIKQSDDDLPF